jgi:hypothetical protein
MGGKCISCTSKVPRDLPHFTTAEVQAAAPPLAGSARIYAYGPSTGVFLVLPMRAR